MVLVRSDNTKKGLAMKARHLGGISALVLMLAFAAPTAAETTPDATAKPKAPAKKAAKKQLSRDAAEKQYQHARVLEKKGDEKGALVAYLAAGDAGHGYAQKRLGEIYERGNSATKRDYDVALRWYEKARAQGIEIPKPIIQNLRTR